MIHIHNSIIPTVWTGRATCVRRAADKFAASMDVFVDFRTWSLSMNHAYFAVIGEPYIFRVNACGNHFHVRCVGLLTPAELGVFEKNSLMN